jgi:hypothetical protein
MGLGAIWMLDWFSRLPISLSTTLHQVSLDTAFRSCESQLAVVLCHSAPMVIRKLLSNRSAREDETWGCGYVAPTSRRQYTASSFAEPIIDMFRGILRPKVSMKQVDGFFPSEGGLHSHTSDPFMHRVFKPAFEAIEWIAGGVRRVKTGQMHHYVLYIALTILALLFWRLG